MTAIMLASAIATTASVAERHYYALLRHEFETLTPARSDIRIRFEPASRGLPDHGSWRNGLAVADMNEDGLLDLIVPPQRGELGGTPHIFLQNRDGSWNEWNVTWPRGLNYGSVAAADFNGDGHVDLAFAIHLYGMVVFLGDGKGHFKESSEGLPDDFPTRRVIVADVDRDGAPDLVALSEGPSAVHRTIVSQSAARLRVYLNRNRGSSWQLLDVSGNEAIAGDWLAAGDLNGDGTLDFIASSIYFNQTQIVYLSEGPQQWQPFGRGVLPRHSYYFAVTAGRFRRRAAADDAIVTFGRRWPEEVAGIDPPRNRSVVGLDRLTWENRSLRRIPIARWGSDRPIWGLAAADFNGDGLLDLAYVGGEPRRLVVLLNDGACVFREALTEGISIPPNTLYDIMVADVNHDGRPDIILMFESGGRGRGDGSIQVYLNRGAA